MNKLLLVVALLLAGCMPREQAFVAAPAATAKVEQSAFYTADQTPLPQRVWLPESGKSKKPKAVIVAVHGFNDYSNAFETTGEFFSHHGIAVYAYDQRGFGHAPSRGIWAGEGNLNRDLKQYVELLSKRYPSVPVYIFGESMGAAVVITAVSDPAFPKVKGIVLLAPAVWGGESMSPVYTCTLWVAAHTFPFTKMSGRNLKIVPSNNYPMLRKLAHDPIIIKKTRIDAIYGVVNLMGDAFEKVPDLRVPVLMMYGGKDQVIPPNPIKYALSRFSEPVTFVYYPEGFHMLLRDLQGELVMKDILSWMGNSVRPVPSGLGKVILPEPKQ